MVHLTRCKTETGARCNCNVRHDRGSKTRKKLIRILLVLPNRFAPPDALTFISNTAKRLVVITSFVVVFLSLTSFATGETPFESLAATAAYAAVLVVLLQTAP